MRCLVTSVLRTGVTLGFVINALFVGWPRGFSCDIGSPSKQEVNEIRNIVVTTMMIIRSLYIVSRGQRNLNDHEVISSELIDKSMCVPCCN